MFTYWKRMSYTILRIYRFNDVGTGWYLQEQLGIWKLSAFKRADIKDINSMKQLT